MARRLVIAANLIYAVALVVLGLAPEIPSVTSNLPDSVAHALAAAIQAGLLFALFRPWVGSRKAVWLAATAAVAYGGLVECLQLLQPARTAELRDVVANTFGAGAAASIAWFLERSPRSPEGR